MIPTWVGPAAEVAGAVGGALISNSRNRRSIHEQIAKQEEFAKNGIQWRVNDARAAGIHPLYALGAQTTSYSPITVGDNLGAALAESGQSVSRAISAQQTPEQKESTRLSLELLRSQIEESDARRDVLLSEARRNSQPGTGGMPSVVDEVNQFGAGQTQQGSIELKPKEITTSSHDDIATTAGKQPFFDKYLIQGRDGELEFRLPDAEMLESLAEMPIYGLLAIYAENAAYYGPEWKNKFGAMLHDRLREINPLIPAWNKFDYMMRRWAFDNFGKEGSRMKFRGRIQPGYAHGRR